LLGPSFFRKLRVPEQLNKTVANEIDRSCWTREKRKLPVDIIGGASHSARWPTSVDPELRRNLLKDDEPISLALLGDIQLDEDGYPKHPAGLDRRPLADLAQAE
jgi:hypothetical protein